MRRRRAERRGRLAESLAVGLLTLKGYRILARRYRCPLGEVDVVAARGRTVVAVEVKARSRRREAVEGLTAHQRRRIERTAIHFLKDAGDGCGQLRFDVVAVGRFGLLRHHIDAWRPQMG